MKQERRTNGLKVFLQLLCVAGLMLLLWGCGNSENYDEPNIADSAPVAGAATNVLIEPATLKSWMDKGLVNGDGVYDQKVVVFDYGSYTMNPDADAERIAGACRVNNPELASRRVEGVATAFPLVATGEQMDAVLQRLGIDEDTVLVFTTSGPMYFPTRAYWMFRYWGFPRENLKLLNGGNAAFAAAYPELMTREVPVPVGNRFSVKELEGELNSDLRLSIGEMLDFVSSFDAETDVILDARGPKWYSGEASSPGYVTGKVDLTVYDGHPQGGQYLAWGDLFGEGNKFKTREEIEALFAAKGWTKDKTTTVYCLSGYSATPLFFAAEAILGAPVRLYDGSWSQFGQYSDNAGALGELPAGSIWSTDQYLAVDEGYRYNINHLVEKPLAVETLVVDENAQAAPFAGEDAVPSQMEVADAAASAMANSIVVAPSATQTDSVLIDAATLQGWMDAGLVNAAEGERVVILDATTKASYLEAHIPGARWLDVATENGMTRLDGVVQTKNMILTAEKMDALLANHGIDENTTVVITTSGANYYASRAYVNLRYWGFPKERIKVLNGYNAAFGTLTSDSQPAAGETALTVLDLAGAQVDLRATLSEIMDAVRDDRGMAIDFRGDKVAAGSTPGLNEAGTNVVFEGRLNNGSFYAFKSAFEADGTFKSAADIKAEMLANGIDTTLFSTAAPAITYCTSGYVASTGFFIMDAILEVPAMIYDGSWSQWGMMSANADKGGNLVGAAGDFSAWAVDNDTYMSIVNYNRDELRENSIEALNPDAELLNLSTSDEAANQVENADADYRTEATGVSAPAAPPTANGGDASVGC
jgi:3-mercaptopyruvate sulfurtransferase SseA